MEQILSLALRPRQLEYLVGQKKIVLALRKLMAAREPQAFLFHGSPGTGKTSIARIIALSFQCGHQKEWGQPCQACWDMFSEFNIHEVNAAEANGVEEITKLVGLSRFAPMPPSKKRVFILDEAQKITSQAQQLLLKPIEQPPRDTIWIVCTTEPNKLSAALQRRFVTYALEGMSNPERVQVLLRRAAKFVSFTKPLEALVVELAKSEITSPALILMAFEQFVSGQTPVDSVAAVRGLGGGNTDSFAVCKSVIVGNWSNVRKLLADSTPEESRWLRASVAGYLKGALLREQDPVRTEKLSLAIRTLMGIAPLEDASLYPWLLATLATVCKQLR